MQQETIAITKVFINGFAETVYQLANGDTLYVSYHQDSVRIVHPQQ